MSDVAGAWARIDAWLRTNAPALAAGLRPPASEEALRALESALEAPLPADLRASWAIHDGQEPGHTLVWWLDTWQLLPVADALAQMGAWSEGDAPWRPGLVPVALSLDDLLCADAHVDAPWIHASHDESELVLTEEGPIGAYLERLADDLERGRMIVNVAGELEPAWPFDAARTIERRAREMVARLAKDGAAHEVDDAQERALAAELAKDMHLSAAAIAWRYELARALWVAWDRLDEE
jgi:hypothetical protein